MSAVERLRQLREQYAREGKIGGAGGNSRQLFFRPEDRAFVHFIWDGRDESSDNFRFYLAHQYEPAGDRKFGFTRPCLKDVFGASDCPGCAAELRLKPRMAIRFYVHGILHTTLREGEAAQLPLKTVHNATGYWREINDIRIWDTSAWRDSPFDDILNIAEQTDLTSLTFQLYASGVEKARRYKVIPIFNSAPLDLEWLAGKEAPTVIEFLRSLAEPDGADVAPAPAPVPTPAPESEETVPLPQQSRPRKSLF